METMLEHWVDDMRIDSGEAGLQGNLDMYDVLGEIEQLYSLRLSRCVSCRDQCVVYHCFAASIWLIIFWF